MQQQPGHCFHEETVRFYAAEILLALEYLHLNGFIYRDLKMENVLVHESGHIMITDFDLSIKGDFRAEARLLDGSQEIFASPVTSSNSFVGTAEYLAPEVICGTANQSCSVDWWTYGILMYEGIYGHTPFQGKTTEQICAHILDGGVHFPDHMYPVSHDCKSLIKKLLDSDPKKRLGGQHDAADIKKHKFFDKINFALIRNWAPPIVPKLKGPLDVSHHMMSKEDAAESDTDSELSEDEQMVGPFAGFKQVFQETRTKRTSVLDASRQYGRSSNLGLRASSGSVSSGSGLGSSSATLNTSASSIEHSSLWAVQSTEGMMRRTASCNSMDEVEFWAKCERSRQKEEIREHQHREHHPHHHHHQSHSHHNIFSGLFHHKEKKSSSLSIPHTQGEK
eukprot:TRINITY_DN5913_c0_g5_i2.p2 TRINITY_DN5913_c0_g5~~TRINITY_DN5913_c0_g5_i2.p2  ORF type:complete len:393 (+),score=119.10 TRINITY_DN5913_c0_g5_i2:1714-2892(+)